MGFCSQLLFLSCILINLVCLSIAQLPDFTVFSCTIEGGNYTVNGTYQTKLNTLLSSLSSNTNEYGFYNATEGQNSDRVEAMVLCRGDVDLETCRSCIDNSTTKLTQLCPNYKEAIGWYDQCFFWYTNKSIVGDVVSESPSHCYFNINNVSNVDQFNQQLNNLLETLRSRAAAGNQLKVAAGNTTGPDFSHIYALTQCTPVLSEQECSDCLVEAIEQIPKCCNGKQGGRILQPSCNFRFEIYRFFGDIPVDVPPSATPSMDDNTTRTIIIIAVPTVTFLVVIIISICIFMREKKQRKPVQNVVKHDDADEISIVESLQYDFGTINIATDNFSDSNKLGQGGFGAVYRGRLPNGQLIAVKRLSMDSGQGESEFKNEVVLLAQLQHRNLVRLLGFSLEGSERLLIYEFVPNSSLDFFLFDPIKRPLLDWETRYKIIGGIARGLLYLHEDSRLRIIHRDLKASNVLVDIDLNPKISDFGMARLFVRDETQGNTSRIVGTFGYMAPEYAMHGQFSVKTDVFSFGILVLEIVSGQKNNCFSSGESTKDLLSYAWKSWREGMASNLVDPILRNGSGSMQEMIRCIHIGLLCVQENVTNRPTMASVILMLNSSSLTLLAPSESAFVNHSSLDPKMSQLQEDNSEVSMSSQSKTKSTQVPVNKVSMIEMYPR
ncbi:Non-specific serine/threonine protein kinase [Bertholletia excelsa]